MKALVVYESMFGNTEQVARAVGKALSEELETEVYDVVDAPADVPDEFGLVVAGGPTHAFSMSRASTRADAVKQGARAAAAETGLREWLDHLPARETARLATFDTRVGKVRHLPGSAAKAARKAGRKHGFATAAPPESFWVADTPGPLLDGELDRARQWARSLLAGLLPQPR